MLAVVLLPLVVALLTSVPVGVAGSVGTAGADCNASSCSAVAGGGCFWSLLLWSLLLLLLLLLLPLWLIIFVVVAVVAVSIFSH